MVLCSFVGVKDHRLGEKLVLVCVEICTTRADVLIMASDLIPVWIWISQWLRFASQGLTLWRTGFGRESLLFAASVGVL